MVKAFEVYNQHYDAWNLNQCSLFWRQVIGYLERLLPAVVAQAFCQGLYNLLENKEPPARAFKLDNWVTGGSISYFPLPGGASGLGVDFGVHSAACFRDVDGGARFGGSLKNYVEQIQQTLSELSGTLSSQPSERKDKRLGGNA